MNALKLTTIVLASLATTVVFANDVELPGLKLRPGSMTVGPAEVGSGQIYKCGFIAVGPNPSLAINESRRICAPRAYKGRCHQN
jgi:hypothetical protein